MTVLELESGHGHLMEMLADLPGSVCTGGPLLKNRQPLTKEAAGTEEFGALVPGGSKLFQEARRV